MLIAFLGGAVSCSSGLFSLWLVPLSWSLSLFRTLHHNTWFQQAPERKHCHCDFSFFLFLSPTPPNPFLSFSLSMCVRSVCVCVCVCVCLYLVCERTSGHCGLILSPHAPPTTNPILDLHPLPALLPSITHRHRERPASDRTITRPHCPGTTIGDVVNDTLRCCQM